MPETLSLATRAQQWAFFMSWRLRARLVRAIVPRRRVRSRGLAFTLPADNWITYHRWRTYDDKEPETLDWIDGLPPAGVLFDIGANIGLYTIYAAKRHPSMRVAAFEPEYSNLHLLRDNIVENALGAQVTTYPVALGRATSISYLHVQDLHPGAALHTVSSDALTSTRTDRAVVWREGIVQMALDDFCEQAGLRPSAIKIDVDGNELEVLAGAVRTLASPGLRSVLIEMPADAAGRAPCAAQLEAAGLRPAWTDASGRTQNEVWNRS
jgi:FkbM family methyltransferase